MKSIKEAVRCLWNAVYIAVVGVCAIFFVLRIAIWVFEPFSSFAVFVVFMVIFVWSVLTQSKK